MTITMSTTIQWQYKKIIKKHYKMNFLLSALCLLFWTFQQTLKYWLFVSSLLQVNTHIYGGQTTSAKSQNQKLTEPGFRCALYVTSFCAINSMTFPHGEFTNPLFSLWNHRAYISYYTYNSHNCLRDRCIWLSVQLYVNYMEVVAIPYLCSHHST